MANVGAGEFVVTTRAIVDRRAFFAIAGVKGSTRVSVPRGERMVAATDSFGGNVWAHWRDDTGRHVVVPLAEGEWR